MHQTLLLCAGILGLSLVLSVSIYVFGRLRIAQQATVQKLLERGAPEADLLRSAGFVDRGTRDLRRGLFLIGLGLAWSIVTYFLGGPAWIMGTFPVTIGVVYLLFRLVDGRAR